MTEREVLELLLNVVRRGWWASPEGTDVEGAFAMMIEEIDTRLDAIHGQVR